MFLYFFLNRTMKNLYVDLNVIIGLEYCFILMLNVNIKKCFLIFL